MKAFKNLDDSYVPKVATVKYDKIDLKQNTSLQIEMKRLSDRYVFEERIKSFRKLLADVGAFPETNKIYNAITTEKYGINFNFDNPCMNTIPEEDEHELSFDPDSTLNEEDEDLTAAIDDQDQDMMVEFPPENSPKKIKEAWNKTMAALTKQEQFMALYLFMTQSIIANLKIGGDCEFKGIAQPGDPDYENIFSTELDDWTDLLEDIDDYLDLEEEDFPQKKGRIDRNRNIIDTFRKNIWEEVNSFLR